MSRQCLYNNKESDRRPGSVTAIYARQSVDRPDSISVESQVEFCRRETENGEVRIYADRGYSGKNTDRPGFLEMLTHIETGQVGRVVVYRLDRISRSVLDFANIIDLFQRFHVDFVSVMEKFDTGTPIGKAMLMVVMIFAQLERETIQLRVMDAYRARSQRGLYMGGKVPYGFRLKETMLEGIRTKMYEPIPEEAEVVQMAFALYGKPDCSLAEVARALELCGAVKRDGKPFSRGRIRDMMVNPIYVRADERIYDFFLEQGADIVNPRSDFVGCHGAYLYAGEGARRKTLSCAGHSLVLAPHEGLVPPTLWLVCRKKCLAHSAGVRGERSWLSGRVVCALCGGRVTIKSSRRKTMSPKRYCICRNPSCSFHTMDADNVEQLVGDEIERYLTGAGCKPPGGWQTLNWSDKAAVAACLLERVELSCSVIRLHWNW